jgi:hypothetical protein
VGEHGLLTLGLKSPIRSFEEAERPIVMKGNDPSGIGISGLGRAQDVANAGQNRRGHGACTGTLEQVQLSNLRSALSALQADSPELTAKLAHLSAVVGTGNYQIDADALTGSIIRDASGATG